MANVGGYWQHGREGYELPGYRAPLWAEANMDACFMIAPIGNGKATKLGADQDALVSPVATP